MEKSLAQLPLPERLKCYQRDKEEYEKNSKKFVVERTLQLMNYICIIDSETYVVFDFERQELLKALQIISTLV